MECAFPGTKVRTNSDAHSPAKIGREANVFDRPFTYKELKEILKSKDRTRLLYTVEFKNL